MTAKTGALALEPYQRLGARHLAGRKRALLADEMGLGKTPQAVAACAAIRAERVLVVCPAIARTHWYREFRRWYEAFDTPLLPTLCVVSYDHARARTKDFRADPWDVLIVDECHYTKSIKAGRTAAIWGKEGIARRAHRVWCLSGTPAPNHAGELWPMLTAFGAVKVSYWDFLRRYCRVTDEGKVKGTRKEHIGELYDILSEFTLRRRKRDVALELPPITVRPWSVDPDPSLLGIVRPIDHERLSVRARELEAKLGEALTGKTPDEMLEYLETHVADYATLRRVTAILKTQFVLDTIEFELANGLVDKLVVFGYHKEPLDLLFRFLKQSKLRPVLIYGGTPPKKRDAALAAFNRPTGEGGARVFIGQTIAAGTAIDLTCAHQGIMLEQDWVPGNNAQALMRMHRYGQEHPVLIRNAVLEGSVDEVVSRVLEAKMHELSELFDGEQS